MIGSCYSLDLEIPKKVSYLDLSWYGSLFEDDFPEIPESVKQLTLSNFSFDGNIPVFPEGIESLSLYGNLELVNADLELPVNLKYLALGDNYFESWPLLPENLETLDIEFEYEIDYLPCLPSSLEVLSIIASPKIKCIPNETEKVKATLTLPLCEDDINNCRVATGIVTKNKYDFHVYPNPASKSIQITRDIQSNTILRIVDLSGKLIENFILNNSTQKLDISNISTGLYIVEVESDNNKGFQKLIIQ